MTTVNDFVSNFSVGARSNLYQVQIDNLDEKIKFVCKAAQVPGKTIGIIEVKYLSNTIKVSGDPVFEDWSITVLHDEDSAIRTALEDWQTKIIANDDAIGAAKLGDYFATATITQLKRDGSEMTNGAYKMMNLWPTSVDPIDMSSDSSDTISEFGVTFAYSHWVRE